MHTYAPDKQLLHPKEAAQLLDVHVSTIRRAIHAGSLEAVRLGPGGRYRVRREAIDEFLVPATADDEGAA
jgi:excisionase family DNA binding protein